MSIEELAAEKPETITKIEVDPVVGLTGFQAREIKFCIKSPQRNL